MAEVGTESPAIDRMEMLKAFDETKSGVKGLNDSGLLKLPKIFVRSAEELAKELKHEAADQVQVQVPVIDLSGVDDDDDDGEMRKQIVEQVRSACETWGFFQVVNHAIPLSVLDGMIDGIRSFHEQDADEKKKYYTRDFTASVRYNSNYDLFTSTTASWRDTLAVSFNSPDHKYLDRGDLPLICRDSTVEYSRHAENLANTLLGLLSEALGLKSEHLQKMEFSKEHDIHCHYYPACPEPELAIGLAKHSDAGILTILLQNQVVSGLQVLYGGQWVDIEPVAGGLVINIGDLLQLVSNGKFKSNEHRAVANGDGPRISAACFFTGPIMSNSAKVYGPIEELITEETPTIYKEIRLGEYIMKFLSVGLQDYRALDYYKI